MSLLYSCYFHVCMILVLALQFHTDLVNAADTQKFKFNLAPDNQPFISKDISDTGLMVRLDELDEIPHEPGSSFPKNPQVCKGELQKNFQNAVAGLCEGHFKCDYKSVAAHTILPNRREGIISEPISVGVPPPEFRNVECTKAMIAARCSAYLQFANCMYVKYMRGGANLKREVTVHDSVKEFYHAEVKSEILDDYIRYSGGVIGFLMNETLGFMCRFVNNNCVGRHPQFIESSRYRLTQACSAFDPVTPMKGYEAVYNDNVNKGEIQKWVEDDKKTVSTFGCLYSEGLIYTSMGVPRGQPVNNYVMLLKYIYEICTQRCRVVTFLMNMAQDGKFHSISGRFRTYTLCMFTSVHCTRCEKCAFVGFTSRDLRTGDKSKPLILNV